MNFLRKVESPVGPMSLGEVNRILRDENKELKEDLEKARSELIRLEASNKILADSLQTQAENLGKLALGNATAMTHLGGKIADLDAQKKETDHKLIQQTRSLDDATQKISELDLKIATSSATESKDKRTIKRQRIFIYILAVFALLGGAYFLGTNWKLIAMITIQILQKLVGA